MGLTEKAILKHEDFCKDFIDIKITPENIVDKINAFDWLDLQSCEDEKQTNEIILRFFHSFNFKYPKKYQSIILKAFASKFIQAIELVKTAITEVASSYNIDGSAKGFNNEIVDRFYYIEYWANKKNIPVNYNEKDQSKRDLFNFDTIILSILADKLRIFNEYEINKPKK